MEAVLSAVLSAAFLGMAGAIFGIYLARWVWADELRQARKIDDIRSKTEESYRRIIEAQRGTIEVLERRLRGAGIDPD